MKKYIKPEVEITKFEVDDVIEESNTEPGGSEQTDLGDNDF